eukprot:scaffold87865_cov19-Tisochrysis_lutea.AAC.2
MMFAMTLQFISLGLLPANCNNQRSTKNELEHFHDPHHLQHKARSCVEAAVLSKPWAEKFTYFCFQEYIFNFSYGNGGVSMDVQQKTKAGRTRAMKASGSHQ